MQVRMKTLMAGPQGTRHPGEIHDLSPKEAAMLVKGGYADSLEAPKKASNALAERKAELEARITQLEADLAAADEADKAAIATELTAAKAELAVLS